MSTTARPRPFPACGRWSCSTTWSRSSAITCGRRRRVSTPSSSPGTRVRTRRSARRTSGRICARRARRTALVAKARGDIAKGLATGEQARGGLRAAVSRPRDDGAVELHGSLQARWLRDLDRHAGHGARASRRRRKAAGLPVDKVIVNNHLLGGGFGRRLEPDMVVAAVRIAEECRRPGEGRVDARRRHPARHLSSGLSRHDFGEPVGRQDRRLEIPRHRFGDRCALVAAGLHERHRHRRRR